MQSRPTAGNTIVSAHPDPRAIPIWEPCREGLGANDQKRRGSALSPLASGVYAFLLAFILPATLAFMLGRIPHLSLFMRML